MLSWRKVTEKPHVATSTCYTFIPSPYFLSTIFQIDQRFIYIQMGVGGIETTTGEVGDGDASSGEGEGEGSLKTRSVVV